jgi:hypothetical protein
MAATVKTWVNNNPPQLDDVDLNGFKDENNNLIDSTLQTSAAGLNFQTTRAVSEYAASGDYYTDSGAANAVVLTPVNSHLVQTGYTDGMRVRALAAATNTGATTINVDGIGVVDLVDKTGAALIGGELTIGEGFEAVHNDSAGNFRLQTITGLGTAAFRNVGTSATNVMEVGAFGLGTDSPSIFTGDLDTLETTGFFAIESSGSTNLPISQDGVLIVQAWNSGITSQIFLSVVAANNYSRIQTSSTNWTAWNQNLGVADVGGAAFSDVGTAAGQLVSVGNFSSVSDFSSGAFTTVGTAATRNTGTTSGTLVLAENIPSLVTGGINTISMQVFTSSGTWFAPSGTEYIQVEVVGGGGGGSTGTNLGMISNGAGGGYSKKILNTSSNQTITIGSGGAGSTGNSGSNGGTTSFGSGGTLVRATGGGGGLTTTAIANSGPSGGVGTSTSPAVNARGQGGYSIIVGGGLGNVGVGGGSSVLGGGAPGNILEDPAPNGSTYGGGGSSASLNGSEGGDGSPGVVIVTEYRIV